MLLASPVSVTFAQTNGLDNSFAINGNNKLQGDTTIFASNSEKDEGEHHNHNTTSSHDTHAAHGEDYQGHGGESINGLYASLLSVIGIFVLLGLAFIALRKSMKES